MIQRIQTVYLALGIAALVSLLFFDTVWSSAAAERFAWYAPGVLISAALATAAAAWAIFAYANRPQQRKIVVAAQSLTLLLMLVLYGGLYLANALYLTRDGRWDTGLILALLLPIAVYILFYLARRGIDHDIRLIRSMDRLR